MHGKFNAIRQKQRFQLKIVTFKQVFEIRKKIEVLEKDLVRRMSSAVAPKRKV